MSANAGKIRAGIIGVLGFAGEELLKILIKHPNAEIVYAGNHIDSPKTLSQIFPYIKGKYGQIECVNIDTAKDLKSPELEKADIVFLALPHGASMGMAPELLKSGKRVIDMGSDYRIKDAAVYEKWYGHKHLFPELLDKAVYGLPELYREKIRPASFIANPGCYPTSVILGCAPLLRANILSGNVIVDSKSGISGAGRQFVKNYLAANIDDTYPYQAGGTHRHIPEIEQELINNGAAAGTNIAFTPNIIPQERGMISSIYVSLKDKKEAAEILKLYRDFYAREPFVRILEGKLPHTSTVINTNYCEIGLVIDERNNFLIIFSAIDNLLKGASGQAVQNMNIMFGIDEKTALVP